MKELAKNYDPSSSEDRIYQNWIDKNYFHAEVEPDKDIDTDKPRKENRVYKI